MNLKNSPAYDHYINLSLSELKNKLQSVETELENLGKAWNKLEPNAYIYIYIYIYI